MRVRTLLAVVFGWAALSLACSAATTQEAPGTRKVIIVESYECPLVLPAPHFASRSASIDGDTTETLTTVADILKRHPELVLVEIEGHADANEPADVAASRARAAMDALVMLGVARPRLRAQGYGAYCPISTAEEEPAAARARDRRIAFKIVKTRDGATGVELGCESAAAHGVRPLPVP